jgi:hypothetical protein
MSELCVNCEQLREEINKYSNELLIANKLIIVLEKFKDYLQEFSLKFDSLLDHKYKEELINLENDYKEVRNLKQINENIAENQNKNQVLIDSEDVLKTNRKRKTTIDSKLSSNKTSIKLRSSNKTLKTNSKETKTKKLEKSVKRPKPKKSYHNPNKFKCDYNDCQFTAGVQRLVNDHKNAIHTGERPYVCPEVNCGKSYASLSYLNKHKLDVHSNRRFKCEWNGCEVEVKSRKSLKVHMRRHTGERTFDCDFPGCSFRGTNLFSISDHKNKHTGEKLYKCKYENCGATFPYRCSLYKHYNMSHTDHRPYKCDWPGCESAFKYNQALNLHKNIHTGEKSVKCDWPGCEFRYGLFGLKISL